ncbi:MAG: hypothetical protein ACRDZO_10415 [Egibacteraceae bacterium]
MIIGIAQLLDVLQSLRFHTRRLADDRPSDWDLTRAVDALAEQIDTLVESVAAAHDRAPRSLSFRVNAIGQNHPMTFTKRGRGVLVLVDDSRNLATLALTAPAYPHITATLRQWADRVEATYTE